MFEDILTDNESTSIDVLIKLLEKQDIETKTELEMAQIKLLTKAKWFALLSDKENKDKTAEELILKTLEYYMEIKTSYQRKRSSEIIKGLSEMKEILLENIQKEKQVSK